MRNEAAEDFLKLLIEWRKLCQKFALISSTEVIESDGDSEDEEEDGDVNDDADGDSSGSEIPPEEFEVDKFLDICFGNPKGLKEASALHLKVHVFVYKLAYLQNLSFVRCNSDVVFLFDLNTLRCVGKVMVLMKILGSLMMG